jgi:hypothetical protein
VCSVLLAVGIKLSDIRCLEETETLDEGAREDQELIRRVLLDTNTLQWSVDVREVNFAVIGLQAVVEVERVLLSEVLQAYSMTDNVV